MVRFLLLGWLVCLTVAGHGPPTQRWCSDQGIFCLEYRRTSSHFEAVINARASQFMAVGFPEEPGRMGPADVVVGWMDGGDVHLVDQSTTALHHLNGADSQQDYELLSHGHSHGTTSIAFRRPLVTGDVQDRDLDGPELPFTWAVSDSTFPGHDASGSGILFASNGKWAVQEEESPSETWIWIPVTAVTAYVILLLTPGLLSQLFPPSFSAKVNRFLAKRPLQPRPRKRWDGPTLDIVPAIRDMQVADYCITALWFAATVAMLATPGEEPQGFMCAVALGTLFLPVTKHSIWAVALGSSFERYVRLHRWAARWTFLMLVAHLADQCGSQGADIFTANADDHGFGWVYGLVSFCIMVGFIPLTLEPIRRRYYELFYYTHFLAFPAVAFAMMHSYAVCYAMIPSLVLYFLDKGVQLWSMAHTYRIVKASPVAGGAKLVLQRPDARHRQCDPGQYYFLAIPSVSGLQRHPFTVAHVSSDLDSLTFLIKDMGPSTFTHQMCGLASPPGSNRALLCGPYGSLSLPQPLTQYQTVFLIAGGVGVTPMINIADSLLRSAVRMKVHFIWLSRDPCAFSEWFPEQLLGMMLSEDFEVRLHSTVRGKEQAMELEVQGEPYGAVDDPSSPVSLQDAALLHGMDAKQLELCMFSGRPDWATLFVPYAGAGPTVAVLTCGPAALVLDVQRAVQASRFDFHKECFSF